MENQMESLREEHKQQVKQSPKILGLFMQAQQLHKISKKTGQSNSDFTINGIEPIRDQTLLLE